MNLDLVRQWLKLLLRKHMLTDVLQQQEPRESLYWTVDLHSQNITTFLNHPR